MAKLKNSATPDLMPEEFNDEPITSEENRVPKQQKRKVGSVKSAEQLQMDSLTYLYPKNRLVLNQPKGGCYGINWRV